MGKPALVDIALMADALRDIGGILGIPSTVDVLLHLPDLVERVRGLAERAETVRVVTADRDALQFQIDGVITVLESAGNHDDTAPLASRVISVSTPPGFDEMLEKSIAEHDRLTAERDALRAEVDARIADAVAADRAAAGAWVRGVVTTNAERARNFIARSIEHGDHIDDDAPPLPSLRMTLLLRDELHRQIKALEAERDRRIDPVEHARAVHGCFIACFAGALMEYGSPLPQARMLAGGLWLESAERAALLARVGADVLAEVER